MPPERAKGRRSIRGSATLTGTGLHTGRPCRVTFRGAEPGFGVQFRRVDLDGAPGIPARLSSVSGVERRTTLAADGAEVHTVEHLLAAVAVWELDDLLIEIEGPEPPILDGSFAPFVEALRAAEPTVHGGEPLELIVREPFTVSDGGASYLVGPDPGLRISATIEFGHPLIGRQSGTYDISPEAFCRDLARARTFGFMHEVRELWASGLAQGGSVDNAIVLSESEVVGTTLRWPDEFVRHKAADIVGDLALVGGRVRGHIVATCPSHQGNVALGKALLLRAQPSARPPMDVRDILSVIPHRYPMLLVDRIVEVEPGKRIVGLKNVTINEPFFQGHFPRHPIMPGVLIIEAMAQVGGLLLLGAVQDPSDKVIYFMSLDNVKFRRPVTPGDQIRFELEMLQFRGRTCRMRGVGWVDGRVVVEAEMMARVVDK